MPQITKAEAKRLGIKSGQLHTIIAPNTLNLEDVKLWLKEHGYKIRQRSPTTLKKNGYVNYYTKQLPYGINLIIAYR